MFNETKEKLEGLGAEITTKEIKQQPDLWKETYKIYSEKRERIQKFLSDLSSKHEKIRVIFTGAGTSAYVGDTIVPYLKEKKNEKKWDLQSVPTTSIVSNPYQFYKKDIPTLLVSFARSGNSPESVATVELGKAMINDFYQVTITCSTEGKLAKRAVDDEKNLLLLMPEKSNDAGFAMTGAFTCMTLGALLVFDDIEEEDKKNYVQLLTQLGENVISRERDIQSIIDMDFDRVIYLGSGSFTGLAREAQLKILELTAGKVATAFDSTLGFRHGPKSFVDEKTLAFVFVSNNPYTRQYDIDMLNELNADGIARNVLAIQTDEENNYKNENFLFDSKAAMIPDAYLALPFVMVAQTVSLLSSVKVGNKPDTPSPTGTVNRVVKGVTIHEYN